MKIIKFLILILFIVAALFIGIGFASGATWDSLFESVTSNDDYVAQEPIVYDTSITSLVIDAETRDIKIMSTDASDITINHYRIENEIWTISLVDSVLLITQQDAPGINGWFNWRLASSELDDIIIEIPAIYIFEIDVMTHTGTIDLNDFDELNDVMLETDTGSIRVNDITSTHLDVSSDTGSITLDNINVSDDTVVETNTGSATITSLSTQNLSVDLNTGSINIETLVANQIDLLNNTGSINVNGIDLTNRSMFLKTDTGSVNVNGTSQGHLYQITHDDQSFYINAETDTGSINISA